VVRAAGNRIVAFGILVPSGRSTMKIRTLFLLAGCAALAVALVAALAAAERTSSNSSTTGRIPVIVELFTSEGCSSCPPADELMTKLVSLQPVPGVEIIALGEHVDYWDHLGWRDPFSSAAFSARQSEYASRVFHTGNIYTPQMVVNGHEEFVGSDYVAATAAIARAARLPGPRVRVTLKITRNVSDSSARFVTQVDALAGTTLAGTADVFLAIAEDGLVTQVRRGENGGRQLRHSAATRFLASVGAVPVGAAPWSAATTVRLARDWDLSRTRIIAFVQDRSTKQILGATSDTLAAAVFLKS
jgi:hypothetical protein